MPEPAVTPPDSEKRPPVPSTADYFPVDEPRDKQLKALHFIDAAMQDGFRDIVLAAPTGIGKSWVGVATCLWAKSNGTDGSSGGYYLVTQKLLQDQLENDFRKFHPKFSVQAASIKSSAEYACPSHGTCMLGGQNKPICSLRKEDLCAYKNAYSFFAGRPVAVTNYPYFMTERTYVQRLPKRRVVVLDECHTLERQILGFVDVTVGTTELSAWAPHLRPMPDLPELGDFTDWLDTEYLPVLDDRFNNLRDVALQTKDPKVAKEFQALEAHRSKVDNAVETILKDPHNWVYWREPDDTGDLRSTAKPIDAAPFAADLVYHGTTRIYMSAYPGPKSVFCRSLGLKTSTTAWCSLSSSFPVENRPIHLFYVGSMGRRDAEDTTPRMLRMVDKIMTRHAKEKGLIHCASYRLGGIIQDYLMRTSHAPRVLYPTEAKMREPVLREHYESPNPTVILSPSMTEGFSLDDDAARWQIIVKVGFPYLGDRQVAVKKERDPDWYAMQAAMMIVQACGRIVRCVDRATEILTDQGWKNWETLQVGDVVYGADPTALDRSVHGAPWDRVPLVAHTVQDIHHYEASPTLEIVGETTHQIVTQDHQVVVQQAPSRLGVAKASELPDRFCLPLAGRHRQPPALDMGRDWLWLAGYLLGRVSEVQATVITVPRATQQPRLVRTLDALQLQYRVDRSDGRLQYRLSPVSSARVRDVLGRYTAPEGVWSRASTGQRRHFFRGFFEANGRGTLRRGVLHAADTLVLDRMQGLLVLLGYRTTLSDDSLTLAFAQDSLAHLTRRGNVRPGPCVDVWCPTTEAGTFIARRSGTTFLTGNSDTDHGSTYVLDSDFETLLRRHPDFFPRWFQQALIHH